MRYLKKAIFAFKADKREFVYEVGQIAAKVDQHFVITDETVTFTITVEMQRFEYETK